MILSSHSDQHEAADDNLDVFHTVVIMEDLKRRGLDIVDKQHGCDCEHADLDVIGSLSRFNNTFR